MSEGRRHDARPALKGMRRPACASSARLAIAFVALAAGSPAAAGDPPIKDPTRPPYAAIAGRVKAPDSSLLLSSTSVSPAARSAVINDRAVSVGSRIAGAVVTAIDKGRVTLVRGSESIVLQLYAPPVKRPARESS